MPEAVRILCELCDAAADGDLAAVRRLLASGAHHEAPCSQGSPLRRAAEHGHAEVVELLLASGAAAEDIVSALHAAAEAGKAAVIALLRRRGTPVDVRDDRGRRPG